MIEKVNSSSASVIVNQTVTEEHLVSMEDDFEQVYMMLFKCILVLFLWFKYWFKKKGYYTVLSFCYFECIWHCEAAHIDWLYTERQIPSICSSLIWVMWWSTQHQKWQNSGAKWWKWIHIKLSITNFMSSSTLVNYGEFLPLTNEPSWQCWPVRKKTMESNEYVVAC